MDAEKAKQALARFRAALEIDTANACELADAVEYLRAQAERDPLERFVELAYERDCSLDFRAAEVDGERAQRLVRVVGEYNDFDPEKVCAAIAAVADEVAGIRVGRENSPVIYVLLPYWTHQQLGNIRAGRVYGAENQRKLSPAEISEIAVRVYDAFDLAEPNESGATAYSDKVLRFWWD